MNVRSVLLRGAALAVISTPALAAASDDAVLKRLDRMQQMIEAQQKQIEAQRGEIGALRHALARRGVKVASPEVAAVGAPTPAPIETKVADQQAQIDRLKEDLETTKTSERLDKQEQPIWSLTGGRPSVTSADGRFSFAIRVLGQFDSAYYMQSAHALQLAAANGPDLSNGSNFRRAQIGFQGKLFGDWSYFFNLDFGSGVSSGNELQGRIQQAYVEYDGLGPWAFRVGAFPASAGLEDSVASADTIFLERNSPADITRNLAGGDGRDAIAVLYTGDKLFASLALTGGKVADTSLFFDEQRALLGRAAYVVYANPDTRIVLSASGTDVVKPGDAAAGPGSARNITLQDPPELVEDDNSIKLVSTGAINAGNAWEWGVETGAQWRNLYGQAGYFQYGINQRGAVPLPSLAFDGWYAQGTWVLTGESRGYSTASGAFTSPKPRSAFSLDGGGWGAWEVAGRYSDLNLNDRAGAIGSALPAGGVRGGNQRIVTLALNWYPVSALKFALQYQNVDVSRIGTIPALAGPGGHPAIANTQVGQTFDTIAFRSQLSL